MAEALARNSVEVRKLYTFVLAVQQRRWTWPIGPIPSVRELPNLRCGRKLLCPRLATSHPINRCLYGLHESQTLLLIALNRIKSFIEFIDQVSDDGLLRRFGREYRLQKR